MPRNSSFCRVLTLWAITSVGSLVKVICSDDFVLGLSPPDYILGEASPAGQIFLRHPWPIRNRQAELLVEKQGDASTTPIRNVVTHDGVDLRVMLTAEVLQPRVEAALHVNLFSISFTGPEARVDEWMSNGGLPPRHNPLRFSNLFRAQFTANPLQPDELGDVCIGEAFQFELCARVSTCFIVQGGSEAGGSWQIALPARHASNYRVETYLAQPSENCQRLNYDDDTLASIMRVPWWAPPVSQHTVHSLAGVALHAAYFEFRVLHLNRASYWWSKAAQVKPTESWMEMMSSALQAGATSIAAHHSQAGLQVASKSVAPHGLWLEFGVGSGKTTAYIAHHLRSLLGEGVYLHGFDSFQGLPTSWEYTHLGVGTFSTGGTIPEHLSNFPNVQIHVGLFSDTLVDLDKFGSTPVAFAHVDVDLYSSAVEVLTKIACQLHQGSMLVFDELVNYDGFELSGEFRAWEYISALYEISWSYAGNYWQQAVPVRINARGRAC